MAQSTLTLKSSSPYHVKYKYEYVGGGAPPEEVASITLVALIADLVAAGGPLHDLLAVIAATAGAPGDALWTTLPETGTVSFYLTPLNVNVPPSPVALEAGLVGPVRTLAVFAVNGANTDAILEIKYRPQLQRSQGPV